MQETKKNKWKEKKNTEGKGKWLPITGASLSPDEPREIIESLGGPSLGDWVIHLLSIPEEKKEENSQYSVWHQRGFNAIFKGLSAVFCSGNSFIWDFFFVFVYFSDLLNCF